MPPIRLTELPSGRAARVRSVHGPGLLRERLVELGFVTDIEVEVLRRAAFSGPLQVRIRGGMLALRIDEAQCIEVEEPAAAPVPRAAPAPGLAAAGATA